MWYLPGMLLDRLLSPGGSEPWRDILQRNRQASLRLSGRSLTDESLECAQSALSLKTPCSNICEGICSCKVPQTWCCNSLVQPRQTLLVRRATHGQLETMVTAAYVLHMQAQRLAWCLAAWHTHSGCVAPP